MKHLSYRQFKDIFGDLGLTNWVRFNWLGWLYIDDAKLNVKDFQENYSLLEYIQMTGTQYIDSGKKMLQGFTTHLSIKFTNASDLTGVNGIVGYEDNRVMLHGGKYGRNDFFYSQLLKWFVGFGGYAKTTESASINIQYNIEACNVVGKTPYIKLNGNMLPLIIVDPDNSFRGDNDSPNIEIGRIKELRDGGGVVLTYGKFRICFIKLFDENNVLSRHFVSAKRKSDNEVGMYDLANGVFYTNDGTGDFIAGDVIA